MRPKIRDALPDLVAEHRLHELCQRLKGVLKHLEFLLSTFADQSYFEVVRRHGESHADFLDFVSEHRRHDPCQRPTLGLERLEFLFLGVIVQVVAKAWRVSQTRFYDSFPDLVAEPPFS
jgi:hypothetical protein